MLSKLKRWLHGDIGITSVPIPPCVHEEVEEIEISRGWRKFEDGTVTRWIRWGNQCKKCKELVKCSNG